MTPEERNALTESLMELRENFDPLVDQAEGFRKALEGRGWSSVSADAAASEMLVGMMKQVFDHLRKQTS